MNKVIVAGGRNYIFTDADRCFLDSFHKRNEITEIVSGGATGADCEGEKWAFLNGISVKKFPANWGKHGRAAGPIRNREMAQYADCLIVFPGGRGTKNMISEARCAGISVYESDTGERGDG